MDLGAELISFPEMTTTVYTLLVRPRVAEPGWIDLDVYAADESVPTMQAYTLHKVRICPLELSFNREESFQ